MHAWTMDMDPEQFKAALKEVLHETRTVEQEVHTADHKLIADLRPYFIQWLDRQKRIAEAWDKFRLSFIGAVAVALVTGLIWVGSVVWNSIHHFK